MKDVVDPSKVKIAGPGLGTAVRAKIPQSFTVDTSKAGVAPLEVVVAGPRGKKRRTQPGCAHLCTWVGIVLLALLARVVMLLVGTFPLVPIPLVHASGVLTHVYCCKRRRAVCCAGLL